jgi:hypothetical protein
MLRKTRVKSSVIAAVAYNPRTKVLEVEFHAGRTYDYLAVPRRIYESLLTADSIGKYFNETIRPNYKAILVRDAQGYVGRSLLGGGK